MKSIPKLIRRFVGIMMISTMLLVILNIAFYIIMFWKYTTNISAWDIADKAAESLRFTDSGYTLSDEIAAELKEQNVWAILIDDNTRQVIWQTENLPNNIPKQYTLSDISDLSRGYVDGYPTFTGEAKNGLLVLGYPRDSYWKLVRASWARRQMDSSTSPGHTIIRSASSSTIITICGIFLGRSSPSQTGMVSIFLL